jgi:hypothetical protein
VGATNRDAGFSHFLITHRCKVSRSGGNSSAPIPGDVIRDRYSKVCATYDRIRTVLAGDCNEYLPLYRLPDELVVEIWEYLSVRDRLGVSGLSRRFRNIALNAPNLWRYIQIGTPSSSAMLRGLLLRAETAPLHIHIYDRNSDWVSVNTSPHLWNAILPISVAPDHDGLLDIIFDYLPRAVVLNTAVFGQGETLDFVRSSRVLDLESLAMPMPTLRSLRLSARYTSLAADNPQAAQPSPARPLFGGITPELRHLALVQFNVHWSDPIYRHLTYLLIRWPSVRIRAQNLILILQSCPSLTYLGLESVVSTVGIDDVSASVELPSLQRLYITDDESHRLLTISNHLRTPNLLECDFTSADWGLFVASTVPTGSPIDNLRLMRELTVVASPAFRLWMFVCRLKGNKALRLHVDRRRMALNHDEEHEYFISAMRNSILPFDQVESLTLEGAFTAVQLPEFLLRFPALRGLCTREFTVNSYLASTILDALSFGLCPQLLSIDIDEWPAIEPLSFFEWLSARSAPESGCVRLSEVVLSSRQPLPSEMRTKIAKMLDRFVWKKLPSFYDDLQIVDPFSNPTISHTTTLDGDWDVEEIENWRRPLRPHAVSPYKHDAPLGGNDDVMLVYCDRSLQGKWDYFSMPGM